MSNPQLTPEERQQLVERLMAARRRIGHAMKAADADAPRAARADVNEITHALGERGPV